MARRLRARLGDGSAAPLTSVEAEGDRTTGCDAAVKRAEVDCAGRLGAEDDGDVGRGPRPHRLKPATEVRWSPRPAALMAAEPRGHSRSVCVTTKEHELSLGSPLGTLDVMALLLINVKQHCPLDPNASADPVSEPPGTPIHQLLSP